MKIKKIFELITIYNNLKIKLLKDKSSLLDIVLTLRAVNDFDFPYEENTEDNLRYNFEDLSMLGIADIFSNSQSSYFVGDDYFILYDDHITSYEESEVFTYLEDNIDIILSYILEEFEEVKFDLEGYEVLVKEINYFLNALEE
jgi:hypothetical protein